MKKIVFSLLVLLVMPLMVSAVSVDVPSADMSLNIPDEWYVFTRENIENNPDLDELDLTYEFMNELMNENDMYVDAFDDEEEFIVSVVDVEDVGNLNDYFDSEIEDLAVEIQSIAGADSYELYENDYKFIYLEYMDAGYYIINYYTIIADRAYTFTIQKETEFTSAEKDSYKTIIDSVNFDNYVGVDNSKETLVVAIGLGLVVALGVAAVIIAKVKGKNEVKESKENV